MESTQIKATRDLLGLSQVQLAQLLGVHPVTVSKWEREGDLAKPNAYQVTLLQHFRDAGQDRRVREAIEGLLVGAGIGVALALLLKHLAK
jgi:transcriptional regulator with XRE-family HTH domain